MGPIIWRLGRCGRPWQSVPPKNIHTYPVNIFRSPKSYISIWGVREYLNDFSSPINPYGEYLNDFPSKIYIFMCIRGI